MNILGTLQLGLIYSVLALGIFITFRVMNMPDLTVDGSFTLGLSVSAMLTIQGMPLLGLFLGFLCGAAAGAITGFLQTKAGILPLLSGILTMIGLYSINLLVMKGSPNVSLLQTNTVFSQVQKWLPDINKDIVKLCIILLLCLLCLLILVWFFKTGLGLQVRATGSNAAMVRASSINADTTKILSVSIANGLVGLSGGVLAQYQGYADINSGAGIIVVGLASVIIGEVILRKPSILIGLMAAAVGAVIYRFLIALALYANFFPAYMLRFVSAIIVAVTLSVPKIREIYQNSKLKRRH